MFNKFFLGFLGCLFLIISISLKASTVTTTAQQNKFNQLFTHSKKAPKGFEVLARAQNLIIDVYYLDRLIGVAKVNVTSNSLQFITPKEVLDKIASLKNRDTLESQLQKPLDPKSHLVCHQDSDFNCNQLSPKSIDIIYDPDNFRVNLFINPQYLLTKDQVQWLPPSSAGLSYINNIYMAADSGSQNFPFANLTSRQNKAFYDINSVPLYNLTSSNTVAFYNTRLNVSTSYASRANLDNIYDTDNMQLNSANIAHTHKQYVYSAGLLELPSTIFFASNAILGAEVKTTLNTLQDKSIYLATPITLFLPTASTVSILYGSRIVYTAKLPAGTQKIDTANFPEGSYPVTIRIIDAQGSSNVITKMVSNSVLLAPRHMPQNYFSVGYLMGIRQLNSNLYDRLLPIPVYQAGTNYRLRNNMGLTLKILGSNKAAFFNPGVIFLGQHFIFQPGLLLATNQNYGYTTNLNWQKNRWSLNYNISQVLSSGNKPIDNYCSQDDPTTCALNLLNQNIFYSGISMGYAFTNGSFGVFASQSNYSQSNYFNNQQNFTYGATFVTSLYQTSRGSWQLNLNVSRRQYESNAFATISYNFNRRHMAGNLGMGYGHFKNNYLAQTPYDNVVNNHADGNGLTTTGNLIWNKTDDTNYGYTVGLQGNTDPINTTVGATYNIVKPKFQANTYVTNYMDNISSYGQYGGVLNTRYVWAQNKSTFGDGFMSDNSGILIRVNSPDSRATFDVYADDKISLHVKANRNYLMKLNAYNTYRISLADTSKNLYHFDKKERTVTLYPGNIKTLTWEARRMVAIGGHVVNEQNEPVRNARLKGGIGFAMTDNEGYFQININEKTRELRADTVTTTCRITIPKLNMNKNVIYMETLLCSGA